MFWKKEAPVKLAPYVRPGVYLQNTRDKGRGVFCRDDLPAGEIIEIMPSLVFNKNDTERHHKHDMLLCYYAFGTKELTEETCKDVGIADPEKSSFLPMGLGSFCNHLVDPNAIIDRVPQDGTLYAVLKTLKEIPKDTEICISYGIAWIALHKWSPR